MFKINSIKVTILALALILSFASICLAEGIKIEKAQNAKAYISLSSAKADNGDLVISGVLRRRDGVGHPIATHVDAVVKDVAGKVIAQDQSKSVKVSRRIQGRWYRSYERFEIRIADLADQAASIELTSHAKEH